MVTEFNKTVLIVLSTGERASERGGEITFSDNGKAFFMPCGNIRSEWDEN